MSETILTVAAALLIGGLAVGGTAWLLLTGTRKSRIQDEIERQESILRGLREPMWRMEIRHLPADDAALRQAIEARTAFRRRDRGEA